MINTVIDAGDDGGGGGAADAVRAAGGPQAVVAGDQSDRESEEEGLADARGEVVVLNGLDDAADVEVRAEVQAADGDDQSAEDADEAGERSSAAAS